MRKIEQEIVQTIKNQRDAVALREASRIVKTIANTRIETGLREDGKDGKVITSVYLHDSMIAQGDAFNWSFKMCGFPTLTTKSRINAIANAFGRAGVSTKNGKHYSGNKEVDAYGWF